MDDNYEFWLVEQYVDLGNETFWHEKARFYRKKFTSEAYLMKNCHLVGERDVLHYGGRYRIRVVKEETVFDSETPQEAIGVKDPEEYTYERPYFGELYDDNTNWRVL